MNVVFKYFPKLTEHQKQQFLELIPLYNEWNSQINVISRKDMENFTEHHVLHSLAIAMFTNFANGSKIIDVGTGGGFPGIPLAIFFPDVQFTLIDSIGKKIKVVSAVIEALKLENVQAMQKRSDELKGNFDFVISRAVAPLPDFVNQTRHLISKKPQNAISNGILYLKGGDLTHEILPFRRMVSVVGLDSYFKEPFFETKKLVHVSL